MGHCRVLCRVVNVFEVYIMINEKKMKFITFLSSNRLVYGLLMAQGSNGQHLFVETNPLRPSSHGSGKCRQSKRTALRQKRFFSTSSTLGDFCFNQAIIFDRLCGEFRPLEIAICDFLLITMISHFVS